MVMMESLSDSYLTPNDINEKEFTVNVSITLNKTFNIVAEEMDLKNDPKSFMENHVYMPYFLPNMVETIFRECLNLKSVGMPLYLKFAIEDCKNWEIENFDVDIEE